MFKRIFTTFLYEAKPSYLTPEWRRRLVLRGTNLSRYQQNEKNENNI